MVTAELACPVTLPAVGELKVIVHWPCAFVLGPAAVHVPVTGPWLAPFVSVSVKSTCSPAAGTRPAPGFFRTGTVNVWGTPTSLVALGEIVICARTQFFVAGPELPCVESVERVRVTPFSVNVVVALTTSVPAFVGWWPT